MAEPKLLFSLTKKDFAVQEFCTGGPGGQNQNRKKNGIRIVHTESGATGEGRVHKSQAQNKQEAIKRLVESDTFQAWHKLKVAKLLGQVAAAEAKAEDQMAEENLRVETKDENGRWIEEAK